jgi:hypothetical protein
MTDAAAVPDAENACDLELKIAIGDATMTHCR